MAKEMKRNCFTVEDHKDCCDWCETHSRAVSKCKIELLKSRLLETENDLKEARKLLEQTSLHRSSGAYPCDCGVCIFLGKKEIGGCDE